MQALKNGKLLWDDARFAKRSGPAERLTGYFAVGLLEQAGIAVLPTDKHLVILDNACGTGVVTQALHDVLQDRSSDTFEITSSDFADAMVSTVSERIKSSGWTNTKAVKADAQDTKLPSEHFTHIFTNFGPMLFPNPSAMLSECHRMLKPGGVCAFTTWKKVGWIDDVREAFNSMPDLPSFPNEDKIAAAFAKGRWQDEDYVEGELTKHGFTNVKVEAVPNTSVAENTEQLLAGLIPIIGIVYRFWTEEERERYANKVTEERIAKWFEEKYGDQPVCWHWVALVTTSNK